MLSIIVPVYRNGNLVEYCLSRIESSLPSSAELIVVDDSSGAETLEILNRFKSARIVSHPSNRGNTAAYNTGAREAKGDQFAFIDSDVFIAPGSLDELSKTLAADEKTGIIGNVLLYPYDYTIQHAGVAFDKWAVPHLYVGQKLNEVALEPIEERQAVTAAFFVCRRSLFEAIGGFSESYRDGLEDVEFCLRSRELGFRNILSSRHPAMHLESATRGPFKHTRRLYNYSIFYSRWVGRFRPDLYDYLRVSAKKALLRTNVRPPVVVLNFCPTPNWHELVEILTNVNIRASTVHDLSGPFAESDPIDLFKIVPMAFHRLPQTIVFVVEHFAQLSKNRHWFARRATTDVVIDRHANVVTAERLGYGTPDYADV
jgi:GT2 family glycosyltransferase